MVVFTCNHCGDSLQKPKVAKHYETTCKRNPINLTCVDCFTDFKLQEYAGHTKCLTEADRYSAKGTTSKILKGEVKQTEWVNTVNTIIEQQINAKPGIKNILQALVNCDNIPRKKVKFLNFMKNAFGFKFNNHDIEQVWNLLEAHKNAANKSIEQKVENGEIKQDQEKTENLDESNQEKKSKKKKKKSGETLENGTTNAIEEIKEQEKTENLGESNHEKKSKKKRKKSQTEETVENGTTNDNEEIKEQEKTENLDESNQEKKFKKKKKKSEETVENGTTNGIEEKEQENLDVSNQDKKSKKKKKKSEETVENGTTNGIEEIKEQEKTENLDESNQDKKSKKKRKSKQHDTETINGAEETPQKKQKLNETSEENDTSSKKKKKRKSSQGGDESPQKKQKPDETETNGVDTSSSKCEETNDLKLNDSQNDSFSFKQVIIDILTKKSKGLSKESLQNKVFKKYEAIMGPIENKEILLKKYNKKLKAVKEITCDNDKYTLSCSSE